MSDTSAGLLLLATDLSKTSSYAAMGRKAWGPAGSLAVDASTVLNNFGVCTAYIVIIGDQLPVVVDSMFDHDDADAAGTLRTWLLIGVGVCILLPLALLRKMDMLRFTSFAAVAFLFVFIWVTVVN